MSRNLRVRHNQEVAKVKPSKEFEEAARAKVRAEDLAERRRAAGDLWR